MAVHRDAARRDGLVPERYRDEPAREQRLGEIPVMDDLDPGPTKPQNLPGIADLKAVHLWADIHSEEQTVALLMRHLVRESCQTQQAARQ